MSRLLRMAPLWVVLLALLAYGNVVPGAFHLDDSHVVERNVFIRSLDNIPRFFVDTTLFTDLVGNRDYRPLLLTAFAIQYRIGGLSPLPFHVWSLVLHAMVALALFYLVRGILLWTDSDELGVPTRAAATRAALVAGALFAVHTLVSESVNYVNGQAVLLVTLFYLLAMLAYARLVSAVEEGAPRGRTLLLVIAGVLAQCAALCSKPTAITLPVLLLLYDMLFAAPAGSAGRVWRARLARVAPFLAVNVIYLFFRTQIMAVPFGGEVSRSFVENFLTQSRVLVFYYLKHFLWPRGLSIDPSVSISTSWREPEALAALGVLLLLAVAVLLTWRRFRLIAFCAAWWVIALLPVSFLKPLHQVVNEHRTYLPMFGLVVPVALLLVALLMRTDSRVWRRMWVGVIVLLLSALTVNSHLRNRVWQSALSLWGDAAAKSGEWRPHMNYALALENAGRAEEALAEFQATVAAGSYARPHINLGLAYLRRGQEERGLRELEFGVQLWPELAEGHYYLGYGHEVTGNPGRAVSEYLLAIVHNPTYLRAYYRLGDLYRRLGNLPGAREAYAEILRLSPAETQARQSLDALDTSNEATSPFVPAETDRPAADNARAPEPPADRTGMTGAPGSVMQGGGFRLSVSPFGTVRPAERSLATGTAATARGAESAAPPFDTAADSLFLIAFDHQQSGRVPAAIEVYEEVLALQPEHGQTLFNLAYALAHDSEPQEPERAIVLLERAAVVRPEYSEILFRLGEAYDLLAAADGEAGAAGITARRAADYYRRYLDAADAHPDLRPLAAERLAALESR